MLFRSRARPGHACVKKTHVACADGDRAADGNIGVIVKLLSDVTLETDNKDRKIDSNSDAMMPMRMARLVYIAGIIIACNASPVILGKNIDSPVILGQHIDSDIAAFHDEQDWLEHAADIQVCLLSCCLRRHVLADCCVVPCRDNEMRLVSHDHDDPNSALNIISHTCCHTHHIT